jgi:hypothetical protein
MMMADSNEEIRRKVMKGVNDPKKHNAYHKEQLKKDAAKAKATQKAIDKRKGKHTRRHGDDGVIDSGMFSS